MTEMNGTDKLKTKITLNSTTILSKTTKKTLKTLNEFVTNKKSFVFIWIENDCWVGL